MTCRYQGCRRAGSVSVSLDFKPGGTQELQLCADHAWEMYLAVVQWFGGGTPPVPDYPKNAWLEDHPADGLKMGTAGKT